MNKAEKLFEKLAVRASDTMSYPTVRSANLKQCLCGTPTHSMHNTDIKNLIHRRRYEKSA